MQSLKTKQDFNLVYKKGKKIYARNFLIYILKKEKQEGVFLGLSVAKKVGIACERNLIKRRFRALCRLHYQKLESLSLIIVPKAGILDLDYKNLEIDFLKCLNFFQKQQDR
ncbi:ribonuclease P protein component [Helicobacter anatolicus]|uniref:ribonuclease P protein component n=1 Tax=Helicobacter anatolicus TaxID=2905874 RepID=UPI001E3A18F0|nr:ribonuclease P protein component [Helicobacter anatolicus]MCE3036818.1 ribonuclease P protein component [Helicobacter anatolicus]MCE3038342.1 ribonuclease P protein component [Helicobacter anatolicus]MCE3039212.1 ribonuclease P protein component [Helicobacter anatolicus]